MARYFAHVAFAILRTASVSLWSGLLCAPLPLAVLGAEAASAEPSPKAEQEQIEALIRALASPDKAPVFDQELGPPPRYDRAATRRVLATRDALVAKGFPAFPLLVAHVDDNHYSYTDEREKGFWVNVVDGYVCYDIIARQIEVYRPIADLGVKRYWVPSSQEGLKKWWKAHKNLSLREIQLEAVKWALERQRASYSRLPPEKRIRGKENAISDLEGLIKRLESSDKPILPDASELRKWDRLNYDD